jgi:hypothetical protein
MRITSFVFAIAFLAVAGRAHAAPIGSFDWVHDVLFGTGSVFFVINDSANTFEDASVDLFAPGATNPFQTLSLGDVLPGAFVQSIDDLSFLLVPFDLDRVQLTLSYDSNRVSVDLLSSSMLGDPDLFLAASTSIPEPTRTVPEPSTLLLLAVAAGIVTCGARRTTLLN